MLYQARKTRTFITLAVACAVLAGASLPSGAQALFTSKADGTTVNQNLYSALEDVYLNGGPQNPNSPGFDDGFYYFMVTDPSGATLLSTDSIADRALTVSNGRIFGVGASGGTHLDGLFNPNNGGKPVQLFPFSLTPNQGGEYKAWLTKVGDYKPGEGKFGFLNNKSKTDNFKVNVVTPTAPVPEPSTMILSGMGLAAILKRRSKKSA